MTPLVAPRTLSLLCTLVPLPASDRRDGRWASLAPRWVRPGKQAASECRPTLPPGRGEREYAL